MSMIRIDYTQMRAVADLLVPLPNRLDLARQEMASVRATTTLAVGHVDAAHFYDELVRRLGEFFDLASLSTAGMAKSLYAATGDYATADQIVMR